SVFVGYRFQEGTVQMFFSVAPPETDPQPAHVGFRRIPPASQLGDTENPLTAGWQAFGLSVHEGIDAHALLGRFTCLLATELTQEPVVGQAAEHNRELVESPRQCAAHTGEDLRGSVRAILIDARAENASRSRNVEKCARVHDSRAQQ